MSLRVVFRHVARVEFDSAADWYEQRRVGLGLLFTTAVHQVLDRIVVHPDFYPRVFSEIREAPVSGFPYCVYFFEEEDRVVILSVFHTARDPAIWQRRA